MSSGGKSVWSVQDESTLRLPRILCLHGGGTNAAIFRAQLRSFSREMENSFRLVYAEAPYPSRAGPDVLLVYRDFGEFKSWLRWREDDIERSEDSVTNDIDAAIAAAVTGDDMKGASGEWVAVLGFSQGAKISASLLYRQQYYAERQEESKIYPRFRFGIIIAGSFPLVWLDKDNNAPTGLASAGALATMAFDDLDEMPMHSRLRIPTIHLHGLADPGIARHRKLRNRCFDPQSTHLIEWEGAHRLPFKSSDVAPIVKEIEDMARWTES
ncbi:Hypothetical protein R9X50_00586500 [Acrodontium crateriforme]|uniref:Serine hydrolase domain-containing protein n=1 Tax=Acrodontium crateriforme TaxID=150365 RepID=A0AAQ3M8L7_9PEZI|nr:Hypothetical protein R9X50_00586500 [Acrodontium crateriforme]